MIELAKRIWVRPKPGGRFRVVNDSDPEHDVRRCIPGTAKAEKLLGFRAETTLDEMLDEVIPWIEEAVSEGII